MESERLAIVGMSAPYGQACTSCAKAKCKCVSRGNGTCERCHRRGLECRPTEGVRKRSARKPSEINNRTTQLEERLNDLVDILRSQQSATKTTPSVQSVASIADQQDQAQPPKDLLRSCAYPTPPAPIASSASHTSAEPEPLDLDGEPSPFEAESILQRFRNEYLVLFPFVWIRQDMTAQELQRHRPFLWLNIRTVCEKSCRRLYALGDRVRELLARKILVDLERDLDILLGLMVYLGWSTHQTRGKGFQARYANLANSLIQDLRLDHPYLTGAPTSCFFPGGKAPVPPEQTHEQRRAIIGTFILCSTISNFLRIDVTKWTPHMEECLDKLAKEPEYPGDELLAAMARVKLIVEEIGRVTWRRSDYESSGPPWIYIKPLQDRLHRLKRSMSPELSQHKLLQSHLYNAEVLITEMVIFHPTAPITLPLPGAVFPSSIPIPATSNVPMPAAPELHPILKPVDIPRLQILHGCLQAIKVNVSILFSFEPAEYVGFPFALMCHISQSIQTLYRLSVLEEPDWDRAAVRREADIVAILGELADKMSKVAAAAGLGGDPATPYGDMFTKGAGTLRATAAIWGSTLPSIEDATEASNAPSAQFGDAAMPEMSEVSADTMAMMLDLNSDPWLTDLFSSWDGS